MNPKLLLTCLVFPCLLSNAQPTIQWQRCLGGSATDNANCIQQTKDGGYIIAGTTFSTDGQVTGLHGLSDYWIVKLNKQGNIKWQKSLGGTATDFANSIRQTSDGGYIVAGITRSSNGDITSNHGGQDYWVVKLDSVGNIKWQKSFGGSGDDQAFDIQQTLDGGYIIAGNSQSNNGDVTSNHGANDYWIVKVDSVGNIKWQKSLGGSGIEYAYSIQQTLDTGYVVIGSSNSNDGEVTGSHGSNDYWVVKLDSVGNIQMEKTLGGSISEIGTGIMQTTDKGYIITGFSNSADGEVTGHKGFQDYWVVKLNSAFNIEWQKMLGGSDHDYSWNCVQQTVDGGFVVGGFSNSTDGDVTGNHGLDDYWIVKLNGSGSIEWQKSLGGSTGDEPYSIQQTSDLGFIIAGYSQSNDGDVSGNHGAADFWIVKLSSDIVLPLTLLNFSAQQQGKQVLLQWQTSNEVNMQNFIVERSYTGKGFSAIADVAVKGKSVLGNTYNVTDDLPLNGTNYYRLKMINTDGTFAYSNTIQINVDDLITSLKVFPNPTHALLNVQMETSSTGNIVLQISDASGRVINQRIVNSSGTTLSTSLNVSNLSGGVYYLMVEQNGKKQKTMFTVR